MAKSSKSSSKRGGASYFMAILGVTLVLFLIGILGWAGINYTKLVMYFREEVPIDIYLMETTPDAAKDQLVAEVAAFPYTKKYIYKDKDAALKEFMSRGEKDFRALLDTNVLPRSIEMRVKSQYLDADTLAKIKTKLLQSKWVSDVTYPNAVVGNMTFMKTISFWLLGIAAGLCIIVIFLIDNTIKLAMFSNRFLIKTMQMVGATRWFIAKPLNIRAIINGAISATIASAALGVVLVFAEQYIPYMKSFRDPLSLGALIGGIFILGITISLFSTHRSVIKYLKMHLDDLY